MRVAAFPIMSHLLSPLHLQEPRFFNALGNCLHADAGVTWRCDPALEQQYLLRTLRRDDVLDSGLSRAAFEATTEYSWVRWQEGRSEGRQGAGPLLPRCLPHRTCRLAAPHCPSPYPYPRTQASPEVVMGIRRELPWLKLVVSMREPISTEISGRLHRMGALRLLRGSGMQRCG